jgi:hypothetical protein
MHGTGLSCSLGRDLHGVGCTVCVRTCKTRPNEQDKPVPCTKYNTYRNINILS